MNRCLVLGCIFLIGACSADSTAGEPDNSASLVINLQGVRGSSGKVLLAIYDKAKEFGKNGKSVAWIAVPAGTRSIALADFPVGKFAISAFHDQNENNDLDMKNGAPVEGYGNSGDVGKWVDPTFSEAAFEERTVNVKIRYL